MKNFAALLLRGCVLCCACGILVQSASIPRSISPAPARKVRRAAGNGQDGNSIVKIEWSRTGVERYTVRSPLIVQHGDTLQFNCAENSGKTVYQILTSSPEESRHLAEQCQNSSSTLGSNCGRYHTDCTGRRVSITSSGQSDGQCSKASKPNFPPGNLYHFADVDATSGVCQFAMSIDVRAPCNCTEEEECSGCEPASPAATATASPSPSGTVSTSDGSLSLSHPLPTSTVAITPGSVPSLTPILTASALTSAHSSLLVAVCVCVVLTAWRWLLS